MENINQIYLYYTNQNIQVNQVFQENDPKTIRDVVYSPVFTQSTSVNTLSTGGVAYNFKQIGGLITNYDLTLDDYAVEIVSNTINSVTLPAAVNNGGRYYVISRGNTTNDSLILRPRVGDNIDMRQFIQFKRVANHINVMSNNVNSWYVF